jgi:nucleotide-binding universal stress UspA family protein
VISTHGRSGFDRMLLGSVAEHVVRYAACPVLVVPSRCSTS